MIFLFILATHHQRSASTSTTTTTTTSYSSTSSSSPNTTTTRSPWTTTTSTSLSCFTNCHSTIGCFTSPTTIGHHRTSSTPPTPTTYVFIYFLFLFTIRCVLLGDIIIERWVPYGAQAKRRTIVQRAAAAQAYAAPRNVIIQYEPAQVRVVRQFQRLGVTQANPQAYLQQYGASLLDATVLVQQARAAGVVEDIVSVLLKHYSTYFSSFNLVTTSCWWRCSRFRSC